MSSIKEQFQDRDKRLQEWFKGKPQTWDDIRDVIKLCFKNANDTLLSMSPVNSDKLIGKCIMAQEILKELEKYKYGDTQTFNKGNENRG
ncbi:hypothetical protein LCGC14_2986210 [marine sediment metagenome]|uniref:Uncharacterized protein n=1 Tax=marine sediment metagenome TaxID=412755 RepID=A0A0F8XSS3_9ZZZZ